MPPAAVAPPGRPPMHSDASVRTSRKGIVSGAFHHHLVDDHVRVAAYARAIAGRVRPGDVVADLGAGSGLLSGFAARAGARRVYAVDADALILPHLERFVAANALRDVVTVVPADAESWVPPAHVDVVLCEMMETGLMNEDQARVMRCVATRWPSRPRAIVPEAASLRLALVHAEEARHGFRLLLPHFERRRVPEFVQLTDEAEYARVDFRAPGPTRADATARAPAIADGEANALALVTRTDLGDGYVAPPSSDHCAPLVLPLDRTLATRSGEAFDVTIRYEMGSVTGTVVADVRRA